MSLTLDPERRLPHFQIPILCSRFQPILKFDFQKRRHAPLVHNLIHVSNDMPVQGSNRIGFSRRHPISLLLRQIRNKTFQKVERKFQRVEKISTSFHTSPFPESHGSPDSKYREKTLIVVSISHNISFPETFCCSTHPGTALPGLCRCKIKIPQIPGICSMKRVYWS